MITSSCPRCGGPVTRSILELACAACGRAYPVEELGKDLDRFCKALGLPPDVKGPALTIIRKHGWHLPRTVSLSEMVAAAVYLVSRLQGCSLSLARTLVAVDGSTGPATRKQVLFAVYCLKELAGFSLGRETGGEQAVNRSLALLATAKDLMAMAVELGHGGHQREALWYHGQVIKQLQLLLKWSRDDRVSQALQRDISDYRQALNRAVTRHGKELAALLDGSAVPVVPAHEVTGDQDVLVVIVELPGIKKGTVFIDCGELPGGKQLLTVEARAAGRQYRLTTGLARRVSESSITSQLKNGYLEIRARHSRPAGGARPGRRE